MKYNIKLNIVVLILLLAFTANGQDNLGKLEDGFDVRLTGGINMFGPLDVMKSNSFGKIDIIYEKSIVKEIKKTPTIGLSLLGTITPINKRLTNVEFVRY